MYRPYANALRKKKMKLTLQRFSGGKESTLGLLFINNKFACFTIEDEYRTVKVNGETRIQSGTYKIILRKEGGKHENYKKKFPLTHKGMLWLQDVPNFQYVLIHIGNTDIDSEGCILIGDSAMQNITERGFIAESGKSYMRVYPLIAGALERGEIVTIEIFDEKK